MPADRGDTEAREAARAAFTGHRWSANLEGIDASIDAYLAARPGLVELSEEEIACCLSAFNMCEHHGGANRYVEDVRAKLTEALSRV